MKQVLLFVAIVTVMGSLKKPDVIKKCPTMDVRFYLKGKISYQQKEAVYTDFPFPSALFNRPDKRGQFYADSIRIQLR